MEILLTLDKIPRLHNILASFFAWVLLAGLVILPGTFESGPKFTTGATTHPEIPTGSNGSSGSSSSDGGGDIALESPNHSIPLVAAAVVLCSVGVGGMVGLGLRWRNNYIWLLNRLYMPGALNGLAGLLSTVTSVYSQYGGDWSTPAVVAAVLEGVLVLIFLVLFVVYNNLLLGRVKKQHEVSQARTSGGSRFMGKVEKAATDPPFAPGSVV